VWKWDINGWKWDPETGEREQIPGRWRKGKCLVERGLGGGSTEIPTKGEDE